jgi:hypothetical protein
MRVLRSTGNGWHHHREIAPACKDQDTPKPDFRILSPKTEVQLQAGGKL